MEMLQQKFDISLHSTKNWYFLNSVESMKNMPLKELLDSAMNQLNSKLRPIQKKKNIYLKEFLHITITKMNRGDLIFIAPVDSVKNSRSISGVESGFLQANQLDNFASVKLDPTPLSEQNQITQKIMVNWAGSDILAKPLLPPRIYGMVWNFWRMYFKMEMVLLS